MVQYMSFHLPKLLVKQKEKIDTDKPLVHPMMILGKYCESYIKIMMQWVQQSVRNLSKVSEADFQNLKVQTHDAC